ncbi:hypothetical protein H4Q26_017403 [Puccinia striiformis f. sp. tritici PST-130]|nr:hypothetical protein H4Q26_017403 [Puccinia striiformis f. sp. tritici PST-130]
MSTTRMSSRSSSQSSGDDNGSVKGSVSISERSLWPSPVTVPKYFQIRMSLSNDGVYLGSPLEVKISPWNHSSVEKFPYPSCYLIMIGGAFPPNHFNFEASLPSADALESTRVDGDHSKIGNSLGLTSNLIVISNFARQVTNLVRHLESRNEAEILKASVEVVDLPKPTAPSSPQSESPIEATDTVIISTGLSMAGSSRIRELKLGFAAKLNHGSPNFGYWTGTMALIPIMALNKSRIPIELYPVADCSQALANSKCALNQKSSSEYRMPLPIETPAPKASSIIRRFQQTIDNLDGQPAPPPSKPGLGNEPTDVALHRRSWSSGTPGAQLPLSQVNWTPPPASSLSKAASDHTHTDHKSSSAVQNQTTTNNFISSPQSLALPENHSDPKIPSPNLDMLLAPSIVESPDLSSSLAELSQSDLAVQSLPASSDAPAKLPPSTEPPSLTAPKLKAPVSSDARQLVSSSRKQTNITAPTAASAAKVKASDGARSASHSRVSAPRNVSSNAPAGALGSNRLPSLRESQSFGSGPSTKPKTTTTTTATPPTVPAAKVSSRRASPADPSKPTRATRAVTPSNTTTSSTGKVEKRSLSRSRVAGVATPTSGIKKSPSLKSSAALPSTRVTKTASPKLTVTGTTGFTRTPDLTHHKAKNRTPTSTVRGTSTVKNSPGSPKVPLPDPTTDLIAAAQQTTEETIPIDESSKIVEPTDQESDVNKTEEVSNNQSVSNLGIEQDGSEKNSGAENHIEEAGVVIIDSTNNESGKNDDVEEDEMKSIDQPLILEDQLEGLKLTGHQTVDEDLNLKQLDATLTGLESEEEDEDLTRADFDASTTTNTDGEE